MLKWGSKWEMNPKWNTAPSKSPPVGETLKKGRIQKIINKKNPKSNIGNPK
jgi:hypothetical protein